jgi:hypothetical protein
MLTGERKENGLSTELMRLARFGYRRVDSRGQRIGSMCRMRDGPGADNELAVATFRRATSDGTVWCPNRWSAGRDDLAEMAIAAGS